MTGKSRRRADEILRHLPAGQCRMVEVGTEQGHVAAMILESHPRIHLTVVDSWLSQDEQPERYVATRNGHATLSRGQAAMRAARARSRLRTFGERACVLHMASLSAVSQIEDLSLDLVFIDGDHSFEGVTEDIAAWWPKIRPGGWLAGHDFRNPDPRFDFTGVERAVSGWVARHRLDLELGDEMCWFVRKPTA